MHEECIRAAREALKRFYKKDKAATLGDIARMFAEGSRLGRLASGLATDKTEVTGEDGGAIRVEFEAALKKVYGRTGEVQSSRSQVQSQDQRLLTSSPTEKKSDDVEARAGQANVPTRGTV